MDVLLIVVASIIIFALIVGFSTYAIRKIKSVKPDNPKSFGVMDMPENEVIVPIIQLPSTTNINENSLFEISDSTIISRITSAIPAAAETATRTITNNALKNMEVYKAILPSGASSSALAKSKDMAGAVRGFVLGEKGIVEQANWIRQDLTKATTVANSVANVMNVASLIVGQYYMSEINSKLDVMNKNINKISDFQDKEFKSRILSLLARVGVLSQFSVEILENDEQRKIKLANLDSLNGSATELLGQVNETITEISQSTPSDYGEYQENVENLTILIEYQNVLIAVLAEIGKLTYLLGKGGISWDLSYSLYNTFVEQSRHTRTTLEKWHDLQVNTLKIDLVKNRRTRSGIEGFFYAIPAYIIDDKWKYEELKKGMVQKINTQTRSELKTSDMAKGVYADDVQIIIKNGKYYYLNDGSANDSDNVK